MDSFANAAPHTSLGDGPPSTSVDTLVQRLLTELDSLGIATQLGEKVHDCALKFWLLSAAWT